MLRPYTLAYPILTIKRESENVGALCKRSLRANFVRPMPLHAFPETLGEWNSQVLKSPTVSNS